MHCNTLGTFLHELLQDILHIMKKVTLLKTVLFRTKWINYFICKVLTMSDGFGHVRTVCRNSMGNNIVMMSELFSDFRTKHVYCCEMDKMDTHRVKKKWSCERWVQIDIKQIWFNYSGVRFSVFSVGFRQKRGNDFFGFFGLLQTKKGVHVLMEELKVQKMTKLTL